jgi:hypothetical protein
MGAGAFARAPLAARLCLSEEHVSVHAAPLNSRWENGILDGSIFFAPTNVQRAFSCFDHLIAPPGDQ